jgi:hypothetical protein
MMQSCPRRMTDMNRVLLAHMEGTPRLAPVDSAQEVTCPVNIDSPDGPASFPTSAVMFRILINDEAGIGATTQ